MRGHGATMIGNSIQEIGVPGGLFDGERRDPDAGASAVGYGGEVEFLNDEEAEKSSRGRNVPRSWSLWKHQFSKT